MGGNLARTGGGPAASDALVPGLIPATATMRAASQKAVAFYGQHRPPPGWRDWCWRCQHAGIWGLWLVSGPGSLFSAVISMAFGALI
jgi:hypothetical protein